MRPSNPFRTAERILFVGLLTAGIVGVFFISMLMLQDGYIGAVANLGILLVLVMQFRGWAA